jgi:hypothetical protein
VDLKEIFSFRGNPDGVNTSSSPLPAYQQTGPERTGQPVATTLGRARTGTLAGQWRVKVLGRPGTLPDALRQRLEPDLDVVTDGAADVIVLRQADPVAVGKVRATDTEVALIAEPPTGIAPDAVVGMLDAGADCVLVDTTTAELVARIHAVLRRRGWGPPQPQH